MNKIALITPALVLAAGLAVAQKPVAANEQDHQAHHPEGTASSAAQPPAKPVPKAAAAPGKESMAGDMGAKMKAMQEMHQKMMAAKTPEERQALMAEHMKAMQGGMGMMKQMSGKGAGDGMKGMPTDPKARMEAMEQRMDMMQMMMEMMMDRMPAGPAAMTK
ncbi:hypothetical protein [Roseateles flavus]|uniref:DUF4175 domain-containing protein n=1 Tax=Roseateles flavus TaxID=3149041 RepID=A0ABV0GFG0_9BURK